MELAQHGSVNMSHPRHLHNFKAFLKKHFGPTYHAWRKVLVDSGCLWEIIAVWTSMFWICLRCLDAALKMVLTCFKYILVALFLPSRKKSQDLVKLNTSCDGATCLCMRSSDSSAFRRCWMLMAPCRFAWVDVWRLYLYHPSCTQAPPTDHIISHNYVYMYIYIYVYFNHILTFFLQLIWIQFLTIFADCPGFHVSLRT